MNLAVICRPLLGASDPLHVFVCEEKSEIIMLKLSAATVQNSFAWATRRLRFQHPCLESLCRSKLPPSPRLFPGGGDFRTCNHICNDQIPIVGCTFRAVVGLVLIVSRLRAENRGIVVRYPEGARKFS